MSDVFEVVATAARYNSGRSICDSGDHYGRHYENPAIPRSAAEASWAPCSEDGAPWHAQLETAVWLAERCSLATTEHGNKLGDLFELWAELWPNSSWFETGEKFMQSLGYHQHARDNTYNSENDLTQSVVWEVWTENASESDWVWADGAIVVAYIHTGCDVRGGYSPPIFLEHQGEYSAPLDFCCGFYAESGTLNGEELTRDELQEIDEKWQIGYSSCPFSEVEDDVNFWLATNELKNDKTLDDSLRLAVLNSGAVVAIGVCPPYVD